MLWQPIDEFLRQKRLAMVGVSRDSKDFSRNLFREFVSRYYDMVPVNPGAGEIEGVHCFPNVGAITPPVDGVILMTTPEVTEQVVRECAAADIPRVWMYRAVGRGAVSEEAVRFCEEAGIQVVPGACPYMFFEHPGFIHSVHAGIWKLTGNYPAQAPRH